MKEDGDKGRGLCKNLGDSLVKADSWVNATCPEDLVGNEMKIALKDKEYFMLCEVEVWGTRLGRFSLFIMRIVTI